MATSFELTAVFEPVEEGWIQARIVELPNVITAGPTLDEAKLLLADALREYVLALGDLDRPERAAQGDAGQRFAVTIDL